MDVQEGQRKFRVLCIDGGGMRGVYSSAYLHGLQSEFTQSGTGEQLDIGKGFDLIVGTSTGAIIGLGLAHGVPASRILKLYKEEGSEIFPLKAPTTKLAAVRQLFSRPASLKAGNNALKKALIGAFGTTTIGELYEKRRIAIAIPAVNMATRKAWVFKSSHLPSSIDRDNDYKLSDVCLATSAAPIYRSLASIENPNGSGYRVFADGGLCANSPVMVGLIDALTMAEEDQEIEIFSLGTCKPTSGEFIKHDKVHAGLVEWEFGAKAAGLSIDVQEDLSWEIARLLVPHIKHEIKFVKFPSATAPKSLDQYLDLDETRPEALDALVSQANEDVNETIRCCKESGNDVGIRLKALFGNLPPLEETQTLEV